MFFSAMLALGLSWSAAAQNADQVAKAADGTAVTCLEASDGIKHLTGIPQLHISAPQQKNDWLIFTVRPGILSCRPGPAGRWAFDRVPLLAPLVHRFLSSPISVHTLDIHLVVSRHGEVLHRSVWEPQSRIVALGINDLLSEEELEGLKAGDALELDLEFVLERELVIKGEEFKVEQTTGHGAKVLTLTILP